MSFKGSNLAAPRISNKLRRLALYYASLCSASLCRAYEYARLLFAEHRSHARHYNAERQYARQYNANRRN